MMYSSFSIDVNETYIFQNVDMFLKLCTKIKTRYLHILTDWVTFNYVKQKDRLLKGDFKEKSLNYFMRIIKN